MKNIEKKMMLAVDMGNTSVTAGLFRGRILSGRISAGINNFEKKLKMLIKACLAAKKISAVLVSSVVPAQDAYLGKLLREMTGARPRFLKNNDAGIRIRCRKPAEAGIDRILNTLAAFRIFRKEAIVVDCGTATTFDVVSKKGEYLGGAIAPGIGISSIALWKNCARLFPARLIVPMKILGRDTESAMLSGILTGHASMIEGMVSRLRKELRFRPLIIGTGGYIPLMSRLTRVFDAVDPDLTLKGLMLIHEESKSHRVKVGAKIKN